MSFGSCCVSLLYIYVDECGNYLHEKCCSNQTIRMYDNLRHTISLCDMNDTSNEREKRRYERISTIDYESQITITITFINITIVKLHSFFPLSLCLSLLATHCTAQTGILLHSLHCSRTISIRQFFCLFFPMSSRSRETTTRKQVDSTHIFISSYEKLYVSHNSFVLIDHCTSHAA